MPGQPHARQRRHQHLADLARRLQAPAQRLGAAVVLAGQRQDDALHGQRGPVQLPVARALQAGQARLAQPQRPGRVAKHGPQQRALVVDDADAEQVAVVDDPRAGPFQGREPFVGGPAERRHRAQIRLGEQLDAFLTGPPRHGVGRGEPFRRRGQVAGPHGGHPGHEQAPGPLRAVVRDAVEPLVDPVAPLGQRPRRPPVRTQPARQPQRVRRPALGGVPVLQGGPDVGHVLPHGAVQGDLLRADQLVPEAADQGVVVGEVPPPHRLGRPRRLGPRQPAGPVLPERVQQPVAPVVLAQAPHHRLVHQADQRLDHLLGGQLAVRADPFGRRQVEGAGEDGQPRPQPPFLGRAQVVGPVDGRAEGLVAGQGGAPAAGEDLEAVVQAGGELGQRHRAQPDGGQFQGERDAVEAVDQREGVLPAARSGAHAAGDGGGALLEQLHGVPARQRRDRQAELAGHVERLPAGGEHAQPGRLAQQDVAEHRAGVDEVLAGVEDDQQPPAAQMFDDGVQRAHPGLLGQLQHTRQRGRQQLGIVQPGQLHQPHAVRVPLGQVAGGPQRDPALADTARAHQREQP
ncbi:hypothetical protein ACF06Q_13280 [Streptomyces leeuwenhoekii]|uniref:hypothetical protein n=1 Tax=Streptomyces leeuwenhoekii TaxID=1437453 RepID=UPI0036F9B893